MHIIARNSTDFAYQTQSYTLRPDPLVIFRQPPTIGSSPHLGHRRSHSGGSLKLNAVKHHTDDDIAHATEPLLNLFKDRSKSSCENVAPPELESEFVIESEQSKEHDCASENCKRVTLNIAGLKFETQLKTLNRLPSTLLGNPEKRKHYWDEKRKEFFFDRHRPSFAAILYYYQSGGRLKKPVEVPIDIFTEELEFYQMGHSLISAFKTSEGFIMDDHEDSILPENKFVKLVWEAFEYPGSSILSTAISIISVVFILTSIVTFCVETLPQYKGVDCTLVNRTLPSGDVVQQETFNYKHPLFIIESCCITWFVFELLVRLMTSPSKLKFVKQLGNWIDFLSIAPYFIFLIMFFITESCGGNNSKFLSVLRVLRVARIFKLSRFSDGLQILARTMRVSMRELSMFVLFLGIGVVIFAGAIYYAELQQEESFFLSIPDAFWWAVISMTTVGYGDVYPTSVFGKVIGSFCVLTGLLAIALPVPVIVTNFNNIYRQTTGRGSRL